MTMLAATSSNLALQRPALASGTPARRAGNVRPLLVAAAASNSSSTAGEQPAGESSSLQRRHLLSASLAAAALAGIAPAGAALAEEAEAPPAAAPTISSGGSSSFTYTDEADKFSITVPAGWEQGSGAFGEAGTLTSTQARFSNAAGLRRVVAFVPEGKPEISVAVTIQFLAPDFTKMGSFGTVNDFATGVVNRMDNSYLLKVPEWQRRNQGPVQVARLLDAKEVNSKYLFSYSVEKEGEPARTVYQAVAIGFTGRYNRLFTVNATCTSADQENYGPVLQKIVASFTPPPSLLA